MDSTGAGPRFVISASTNAGRGNSFPKNPGRQPITIVDEGWYTFEHRFEAVPPGPGGQLYVTLTVRDSLGVVRGTWTLTDPSDIIGTTVGGNRYGWFVTNEFPFLAFDNSALVGFQDFCTPPESTAGAKVTAGGWIPVTGDKGTFGLTARVKSDGTPSGNLTYQDHAQNRTVKSTEITAVIVTGNSARILGRATVNGAGDFAFDVTVTDNDEPGKASDIFTIEMNDAYAAGGTLAGGNVQIH